MFVITSSNIFVPFFEDKKTSKKHRSVEGSPMEHPLSQYRLNVLTIPGNEKTNNWEAFYPSIFVVIVVIMVEKNDHAVKAA